MKIFGPYYLTERIFVGQMSEVFLAIPRDSAGGERLVLKRMLGEKQGSPELVQLFSDEAHLSSHMFHHNLIRIIDYGTIEGLNFIAMEHVDGMSLATVLHLCGGVPLAVSASCWMMAEVCAGLDYAHNRTGLRGEHLRIVHREVCPENILLSRTGQVKLSDFGTAKASMKLTRTRPGQLMGTIAYMSPEQVSRGKIDRRSDIFSAGLVLYEVTTGRRVFTGRNEVEILTAIDRQEYTHPGVVVDRYPAQLAAVVDQALQWDPGRRYQRAADLGQDLTSFVAGDPSAEIAEVIRRLCEQRPELGLGRPDSGGALAPLAAPAAAALDAAREDPRSRRTTARFAAMAEAPVVEDASDVEESTVDDLPRRRSSSLRPRPTPAGAPREPVEPFGDVDTEPMTSPEKIFRAVRRLEAELEDDPDTIRSDFTPAGILGKKKK